MPMTQKGHVLQLGANCPACGSTQIEGGPVTTGGSAAAQDMVCNDCRSNWTDTYTLTGYTGLEVCEAEPAPDEA